MNGRLSSANGASALFPDNRILSEDRTHLRPRRSRFLSNPLTTELLQVIGRFPPWLRDTVDAAGLLLAADARRRHHDLLDALLARQVEHRLREHLAQEVALVDGGGAAISELKPTPLTVEVENPLKFRLSADRRFSVSSNEERVRGSHPNIGSKVNRESSG